MGVLDRFKRHKMRGVVLVDETGIMLRHPDGRAQALVWTDLHEVGVLTTDDGPWFEDVFFALIGPGDSGFLVPQGREGSQALG
jgi:hypothetical protein